MSDTPTAALEIAKYLAQRSRPQSLGAIADGMEFGTIHRTTLWRWMKSAQELGLVEMQGDRKATTWQASEELRKQALKEQVNEPLTKRPRVPYQEGFLEEYEPNKSFYLDKKSLDRLHRQCAVGSAEFSSLTPRDQSLFLCGFSYASSSLEGNQYDLIATEKLLLEGLEKEGASPEETTMVLNQHESVRYLIDNIHFPSRRNDIQVNARDIKSIHGLLSTNLLKNPAMCGAVRHSSVKIKGSSYIPLPVHEVLERALSTICRKATQIEDPYEQSFFLLVHLPYLQPFEDCNKRTSRVSCNIPLLRNGIVPMSWFDVSHIDYNTGLIGVYERNNTSLLSEVFVDGFMNSTARFEIMQRSAIPNEVQIRYRKATKQMVRAIVLDGDTSTPDDVDPQDWEPFRVHVEQELDLLRGGNIGAVVRHGLREGDVSQWLQDSDGADPETARRGRTDREG